MYKYDKLTKRHSESFKLKVLDELSTSRYSKNQLGKLYGVNPTTINEWIRKYERKDLMNTLILVENTDEVTRLKSLKKR
jgi:transposase-like protein